MVTLAAPTDNRELSKNRNRRQTTKSSGFRDSDTCSCERSEQTYSVPALLWLAPLATGDLNGQSSGCSPSNSYPTGPAPRAAPAPAAAAGLEILERWSSFPLASKVQRPHSISVSPSQILIFAGLCADMRLSELTPPMGLVFYFHKYLGRLCPTFCDRLAPRVFSHVSDRISSVGQNERDSRTHTRAGLVNHLPGKGGKGVPGEIERQSLSCRRGVCAGDLPLYSRISVSGGVSDGDF